MRRLGALLATLVCLAVASACSNGDDEGASGRATTTEVPAAITFATTSFAIEAAAEPAPGAAAAAQAGIESTLNLWLAEGILRPLRSGQPAGEIGPIFTAAAGERFATTPDRAAFVDEGLPPATGVRAGVANLGMVAFADLDGNIPLVTVHFDLTLGGMVEDTPLGVEHTGDFVMVLDAGDAWRIDAYDIRSTRATAAATTTTTAAG